MKAVTVMKVHDLREEFAGDMRANLNKTFAQYGVQIRAVKVTDVKLPRTLDEMYVFVFSLFLSLHFI